MKALLSSNKKSKVQALCHPKDRKVDQFQRELRRNVRLDQQKDALDNKQAIVAARTFWFREQVSSLHRVSPAAGFSALDLAALTQLNIDKNDDEISELKKQRNPPTGRIRHLGALKQVLMDQFSSVKGISVPNILTDDGVEALTSIWDGDFRTVNCVPMMMCSSRSTQAKDLAECVEKWKSLLMPADDVREQLVNIAHAPTKLKRFVAEGHEAKAKDLNKTREARKRSVKASQSGAEIAAAGKQRRVLQQQARTKARRQAAIAASRGLV